MVPYYTKAEKANVFRNSPIQLKLKRTNLVRNEIFLNFFLLLLWIFCLQTGRIFLGSLGFLNTLDHPKGNFGYVDQKTNISPHYYLTP